MVSWTTQEGATMDVAQLRSTITDALRSNQASAQRLEHALAVLDGAEAVQIPRQGAWRRGMLEELWPRVRHLPGVRALFEVCASRAGQTVRYSDVLAVSGLDAVQQKNEHARLSRITGELFGDKRWPIENWQGSPVAPGGPAEMVYRMPATVAAWWHEIAHE